MLPQTLDGQPKSKRGRQQNCGVTGRKARSDQLISLQSPNRFSGTPRCANQIQGLQSTARPARLRKSPGKLNASGQRRERVSTPPPPHSVKDP